MQYTLIGNKNNCKGKSYPGALHEGVWAGGIVPLTVNLGTKRRVVVLLAPRQLCFRGEKTGTK
jgi:hypothetical protein